MSMGTVYNLTLGTLHIGLIHSKVSEVSPSK